MSDDFVAFKWKGTAFEQYLSEDGTLPSQALKEDTFMQSSFVKELHGRKL